MKRRAKSFIPLLLTAFIIVLDRFTKQIVVASMEYAESIPVLGNTVRWTYIHNYGMAFGLDIIGVNILGWISLIAAIVILFILFRTDNRTNGTRWILAAILGGAIGNTYDRLVYGYVIDFIDVDLPAWMGMDRWPVFNIADSAVSVGVVLLVISMFLPHRDKEDIAADEYVSDEPEPDFPLSGPEAPAAGELRNDRSVDPAVSGPEAPVIGSIDQEAEAEDPETEDRLRRLGEEFDSRTSELKDTSDIEENTEDEREKPE